jgi:diguanylate cyclase (GGDEF)-like protein
MSSDSTALIPSGEDLEVSTDLRARGPASQASPGAPAMNTPPIILVSEHRGHDLLEKLADLAAAGHEIQRSDNLTRTLELVERLGPGLIVIEPELDSSSAELEALWEALPLSPPTPVLVVGDVTRHLTLAVGQRAREGGLWDLARREIESEELLLRCEQLMGRAQRRVELELLRHRAHHDDHTDLLRPGSFQERLREHYSAAERHDLNMALLLLDLDRFGQINKLYNHTVGDEVIARVGDSIRAALRTEDVAGRLGGDEFGIVLPYTKKLDAVRVVHRLLDQIHDLTGKIEGADDFEVSGSIGFETFNGSDVHSLTELRLHAEQGLRRAKSGGGNQGVYFRSLSAEDSASLA